MVMALLADLGAAASDNAATAETAAAWLDLVNARDVVPASPGLRRTEGRGTRGFDAAFGARRSRVRSYSLTFTGVEESDVKPLPSSPDSLLPQHAIVPPDISAQALL
jgi:hypothetical protein